MKIDLSSYVPKRELISIPEWSSEDIFVQELSGTQLEMIQKYSSVVNGNPVIKHQYALLIIASLTDKDGEYLFTEKDIKDIEKQPATILARIVGAISHVSEIIAVDL
jgi:hypothetical protein